MVTQKVVVVGDAGVHVSEEAALIRQRLDAAQLCLVPTREIILDASCVPLDEIDDPRQQNGCTLIYLH